MNLPLPATFNPELSSDRLEAVSQLLLDELYATEDDLSRPTDNGYTRGCTTTATTTLFSASPVLGAGISEVGFGQTQAGLKVAEPLIKKLRHGKANN